MTQQNESDAQEKKPSTFKLSLDSWAVTLALALSLLVWLGLIKHIPW
ncbi:MAG: hypothetical protein ACRD5M_11320 [Candidatus Acidiferrales bacterium]